MAPRYRTGEVPGRWLYQRPAGTRRAMTIRLSPPAWAALDWLLAELPGESASTLVDRLLTATATRLARGDAVPELALELEAGDPE